jgi:hypothetical protein
MAFGDFTVDRNDKKYVLGSGGSYVEYAEDEPAFEFNSDGSYKGLLVEPASTNQVRNGSATGSTTGVIGSGGVLPTHWADGGAGGLTREIIGTGTENGVAYIDIKMSGTASATASAIYFEGATQISTADGETWTLSAFIKNVDTTSIYNGSNLFVANYSSTPAFVDTDSASITPTTDLVRHEVALTLTGATIASSRPGISFLLTNGNTYDFTVRIGWVQFEESPIATSPIPTTSASVTRPKDDITLGSASSLIGQTEGTLYVEVDFKATGVTQLIFSVNNTTANDRVLIYNTSSPELRMYARANGGTAKTDQGVDSSGFSGIQKIAFAYKTDDFELYRNGSSISSDTSGSLAALATLTNIDLGQDYAAGFQANMWIRAVALFTRRLSDAEAEALTTL